MVKWVPRSWVSLVVAFALASLVVVVRDAPFASASATPVTTWWLVYSSSSSVDSWAYSQGFADASSGKSGIYILGFGHPAEASGANYGAWDYGGHFLSNLDIATAMENYVDGWWDGKTGGTEFVSLARGTVNNCLDSCASQDGVPAADLPTAGEFWGNRVDGLQIYIYNHSRDSQMSPAGGIDAEPGPGYDTGYTDTKDFVDGYIGATGWTNYDWGSAEQGYWTNQNLWHISYSSNEEPLPKLTKAAHVGQANNWLAIDEWAKSNSKGYSVLATRDDYNGSSSCNNTFTPGDAWNYMLDQIQADSSAYYQSDMPYDMNRPC
jgi:hypothetical protein